MCFIEGIKECFSSFCDKIWERFKVQQHLYIHMISNIIFVQELFHLHDLFCSHFWLQWHHIDIMTHKESSNYWQFHNSYNSFTTNNKDPHYWSSMTESAGDGNIDLKTVMRKAFPYYDIIMCAFQYQMRKAFQYHDVIVHSENTIFHRYQAYVENDTVAICFLREMWIIKAHVFFRHLSQQYFRQWHCPNQVWLTVN